MRTGRLLSLGIVLLGLSGPLTAQAARWQEELSMQLQELHGCKVGFLANVTESLQNGLPTVTATAHCEDGRQFDATRDGERGLFTITACEEKKVC